MIVLASDDSFKDKAFIEQHPIRKVYGYPHILQNYILSLKLRRIKGKKSIVKSLQFYLRKKVSVIIFKTTFSNLSNQITVYNRSKRASVLNICDLI